MKGSGAFIRNEVKWDARSEENFASGIFLSK